MSKIKLLTIAIAGLVLINLSVLAFVYFGQQKSREDGPPMHKEGPKNIIIDKLHFTPQQVDAYQQLIDEHRASVRRLDREIRETKNKLYLTLTDVSTENPALLKAKLGELQQKIETVHYNHFAAIKQLCTAEQMPYFKQLTQELADLFSPEKNIPTRPKD